MIKKSKLLIQKEKQWIGKRVTFYEYTLKRDLSLDGPFCGVVIGVCNTSALIEDGLEGMDFRNRANPTGELIIEERDEHTLMKREAWVPEILCTKEDEK